MTDLTESLLDSLLNPGIGRNAEQQFKAITLPSRIHGLFSLLQSSLLNANVNANHANANANANASRTMLACVLLRRDISSIAGHVSQHVHTQMQPNENDIIAMLNGMVQPLLDFFQQPLQSPVQRQLGFIIAELCSALSILDENAAITTATLVLHTIGHACSMAHKPSLDLLASLAQRAPFAIQQGHIHSLSNVLQAAAIACAADAATMELQLPSRHHLACVNSILDVLLNISIASDINMRKNAPNSMLNTTLSPPSANERMVQMIQLQTMAETDPKKKTIQHEGPVAALGKLCLPSLLKIIHACTCTLDSSSNVNGNINGSNRDEIQTLMQSISQIAAMCPSLLAGDAEILALVCHVLLGIASRSEEETRLAAVEALVTLTMVPDVKALFQANPVLLNLCIGGDNGNGSGNGNGNVNGVIHTCADVMINGVDDDVNAWAQQNVALQEDAARWEDDDQATFAQEIMEHFITSIGAQSLGVVLGLVEMLLASKQWQRIRAALAILEICLIAAPYSFASHVPVAVEAALSFAAWDCSCVRVQFQAVQLLTALCRADEIGEDGSGAGGDASSSGRPKLGVRKQHAERILATLAQLMNSDCTKVLGHACLAIVAYCRGGNGKENSGFCVDKSLLIPFSLDVLTRIGNGPLSLDIAGNVDVYIRAFAAVACWADVTQEHFEIFYSTIMPGFIECTGYGLERDATGNFTGRGSSADEFVALRGGAIEVSTIVGQAVGECDGLFHSDAMKLMQLILPLLESQESNKSVVLIPQDQLLAASARIACVMKASYAPFVPRVLPYMLRKAKEKADVSITDGDESTAGQESQFDEDTGMETITLALPGMGVKKLVLNTAQMQEKAQAARAVYEHANSMGAAFGPFAGDCVEAFLPLLQFKYSADVRATAAQALGPVFDSACEYALSATNSDHATLPQKVYSPIVLSMAKQLMDEDEDDVETLSAFSEAMSNLAYSAYTHANKNVRACMTCTEAKQFVSAVIKVIEKCVSRRKVMFEHMVTGSIDADQMIEYEDLLSVQSEFLTGLVDSIGYTLKTLKELFVPVFDSAVAPFFAPLLKASSNIDEKARLGAICLFVDCVEHCGSEAAAKYGPLLIDAVTEGVEDKDLELREASIYGIAQLARRAPQNCLQNVACQLIPHLATIAKEGSEKRKEDIQNIRLVEYSASAIATMTLFKSSPFVQLLPPPQRTDIIKIFLANLPLLEDFDEAKFCHDGFCELVENGDIDLTQNLTQVLKVVGEVADAVNDGDEIATQETCGRFANIIAAIQSQLDASLLQQAFANITEEARNGINLLMGQ